MSCARFDHHFVIKSIFLHVGCLRARTPALSRRQKRRRFEERYWDNVRKHALSQLERIRQRREQAYDQLWAEFAAIVAEETMELEKAGGNVSSNSGLTVLMGCWCFELVSPFPVTALKNVFVGSRGLPTPGPSKRPHRLHQSCRRVVVEKESSSNSGTTVAIDGVCFDSTSYLPIYLKTINYICFCCKPRGLSSHIPHSNFPRRQGQSHRYVEACLVDSFRSVGVKVPYSSDGPFFALADGRNMLLPFGLRGSARDF